ncbi:hypothetical protein F8568_042715 [Actinomadura sp. LD22]|uniref:Uncharacterized protein n=1 Tax=Actinomadura physcomitrii TaxID=2650748 RepID=A0A6I4MSJ2_9ACTN|nr:hypothetical protein [Actinomadura physcomitrii]MWA06944.1 hypothetical protein [Actinomadura physcomitrii]
MDTDPGIPRRPGDARGTPPHGFPSPAATPVQGTPVVPGASPAGLGGAPIPPDAPSRPIVHAPAPPGRPYGGPGRAPGAGTPPQAWGPVPASPPRTGPQPAVPRSQTGPQAAVPRSQTGPQAAVPRHHTGPQAPVPGVRTGPQAAVRQPVEEPSAAGPMGSRETSGVQVRLGSRALDGQGRNRRRGRRGGLIAGGVLVLAAAVTAGLVLLPRSGDGKGGEGPAPASAEQRPAGGQARLPRTGTPIEVGTADGSKYRLAAVGGGVSDDGVVTTFQSSPPSGTSFAYIEYVLTNPTDHKVLLDFPGDVFLKRALVTKAAQGRCMPQAGVSEDMCTPPTQSRVVRRLAGGDLIPGDGGDKYLSPGASYLVRATVDVPVARRLTKADMGLYVWKQLYMADQLAKQVPFPGGGK